MSPSEPPTRMSAPSVRRYASTIHCCAERPPPRSERDVVERDVDDRAVDERHRRAEDARDQRPARSIRHLHDPNEQALARHPPRLSTMEAVDDLTPGSAGEPASTRRIGRGVFLVTVAGGLSSLWWGKAAWGPSRARLARSRARSRRSSVAGLADLHRRRDDAGVRAGDVALEDRRHGRATAGAELRRAARAAAGVPGRRLPLRDGLDGGRRSLARRPLQGSARRREAAPGCGRARVRLRREAVRRLPHARPGDASRRDARVADGRQAAPAGARRSRPRRDPRDVRLQERQVGRGDQPRAGMPGFGYWEERGYDNDAWVGRSNGYGA